MKPKISVIMPIYNTPEKYLRECLESLLAQKMYDFELICVDDCSCEAHIEGVLEEYKTKGLFLKTIKLNERRGAAVARNVGLEESFGEYVIFLDSDDFFYPDFLFKLYEHPKHADADFCFCGHNICNSTLDTEIDSYLPDKRIFDKEKDDYLLAFPWIPWTKLVKRDFLIKNDIYFQSLSSCNDVYYSIMTILCANKIDVVQQKLVNHRTGYSQQISSNRDPINAWRAFDKLKKDVKGKNNYSPSFDKMLDGMLIVSSISEIKRAKDEENSRKLYDVVRNYFRNRVNCFSTDRLNCLLKYLIDNNYESRWYDHNVFFKWKLDNSSSYILERIRGKKILLWGLGARGDAFLEWAREHCITVDFLYDKDFTKTERYGDIYHVVDEKNINNIKNCIIIASNYSVQKYVNAKFKNSEIICIEEWCSY